MRRRVLAIASAGLLACALAQAQPAAFPTRAVTVVVPFPPGGGTDTGARIVAQKLSAKWGQRVSLLLPPAATPRDIVEKISADVREVLAADDVKGKLTELGAIPWA